MNEHKEKRVWGNGLKRAATSDLEKELEKIDRMP
jgi:hypothetical protein